MPANIARCGGRVRPRGEKRRHDTRGLTKGRERSYQVKIVPTPASAQPTGMAAEQPLSPPAPGAEGEAQPGDAFEATILRLDGTTLERLLKLAGE